MAGAIKLASGELWTASSSPYHWVLEFLIASVQDKTAMDALAEIRDANLGMVDLQEFAPEVRDQMQGLISDRLLPDAEARLRTDLPDRAGYLAILRELADMAHR